MPHWGENPCGCGQTPRPQETDSTWRAQFLGVHLFYYLPHHSIAVPRKSLEITRSVAMAIFFIFFLGWRLLRTLEGVLELYRHKVPGVVRFTPPPPSHTLMATAMCYQHNIFASKLRALQVGTNREAI